VIKIIQVSHIVNCVYKILIKDVTHHCILNQQSTLKSAINSSDTTLLPLPESKTKWNKIKLEEILYIDKQKDPSYSNTSITKSYYYHKLIAV